MKSSAKHQREQNSLELYLLGLIRDFRENREKVMMFFLVLLIAVAGVLFYRYYNSRKSSVQNELDNAYYLSTGGLSVFSDTAPYEELSGRLNSGNTGAFVRIAIGETKFRNAVIQVAQKQQNSQAEYNDETIAAYDPASLYNESIAAFDEVITKNMASDQLLAARAIFGAAAAEEGLAAIAADDAAVETFLGKAKARYADVAAKYAASAYAKLAAERAAALDEALVVTFYKQSADSFRNLPVPPARPEETSILPNGTDDNLDPENDAAFDALKDIPTTDAAAEDAAADGTAAEAPAEAAPAEDAPAEGAAQ